MILSRLALFTVVGALPSLIAGAPLDAAVPSVYTPPSVPIGKAPGPNARTVGRQFEIDGKVGYFAGTNAWWLGYLLNDSDTEYAMSRIANTGYKTVRTWGFFGTNDPTTTDMQVYYQVLNSSLYSTGMGINYGPNGIHRLDVVVSLAEKYNLKIILALLNNWDGLGSISSYTSVFGGNSTTFFTDEANQRVYREYVEFIVNRYKSSSAIFAWELCNEPRCDNCDPSVIYNWAKGTSEWIKSIDNTHMVTLGDEGWMCPPEGDDSYAYACGSGVDFVKNLEIETLDYGTFHLYPDSWGYNYTWGNEWILQHDQAGAAANKAVVLEEYGTPVNHTELERPWQQTVLKDTHLAADSIWQFGDDGEINMGDVNSIYYGTAEYQLLGFKHAAEMLAKPV